MALSAEAISLREAQHIAIDSLDYAVCAAYVKGLQDKGARVCYTSRWMNGATIETTYDVANEIAGLPYVKSVEITDIDAEQFKPSVLRNKWRGETASDNPEAEYYRQLAVLNLPPLHEAGFNGQGITIGVIDGGFTGYQTLTMFDSLRNDNRLLGTFDFADDERPFDGDGHGTRCLGLIAGNRDDYRGTATEVSVYLIRSEEVSKESLKEADNWIAAVEVCDSLGIRLTTTSLGYSVFDYAPFNYKYEQTNGKTIRASRAAEIAAGKGMLLCLAAGNSATTDWPWMNIPSDADHVLTVGAVGLDSVRASFSSFGPTADGRVKPDVCAVGEHNTLVNPVADTLDHASGTSFATPIIAGLAACLWSAYPHETNMQIRERIIRSADRAEAPDQEYGYGIPDAWKAYQAITSVHEAVETRRQDAWKILRDGRVIVVRDGAECDILGNKLLIRY